MAGYKDLLGTYLGYPIKNVFSNPMDHTSTVVMSDNTRHTVDNNMLIDSEYMKAMLGHVRSTRSPSPLSALSSESYRHKLIAMRLRIPEGQSIGYQDLFTSLAGDKVYVFVVQDNQAVTLEDDANMFPSDQLITQLRLLDK